MPEPAPTPARLIEFGWPVMGELSTQQRAAVRAARESVSKTWETLFPQFQWQMPLLGQPSVAATLVVRWYFEADSVRAAVHAEGLFRSDGCGWRAVP